MSDVDLPNRVKSSLRVVGVCGSLRPNSRTQHALSVALAGAAAVGATTSLLHLDEFKLPFCDGRDDESTYPEGVARLRKTVGEAHGVILATPEYHSGYSGPLKNALDLMGFEEFEGKMVGLVAVSGGRLAGASALAGLRTVCRTLHAWVVPEQVGIPQSGKAFDAKGALVDPRMAERLMELGRQVARFAFLHSSDEARAFLSAWERAAPNPGGAER